MITEPQLSTWIGLALGGITILIGLVGTIFGYVLSQNTRIAQAEQKLKTLEGIELKVAKLEERVVSLGHQLRDLPKRRSDVER